MSSTWTLHALAETFEAMRQTRSPRAKEALLAEHFASVSSDVTSLQMTARLCNNRGLSASDPRSIGVGWSLVMEVASAMTGYAPGIIAACSRATGDLAEAIALLAERIAGAVDRPGVPLSEVAMAFDELADASRRTEKGRLLARLLSRCSPLEIKYLLRSIGAGLRIGAQEALVLTAIARAFDRDAESVRWAFARTFDTGVVALLARDDQLATAALEIGRPAAFMLATPRENLKSPLDPALFVVEDKVDGIRAQVHKRGNEITIFARGLSRVSEQYPEIVSAMRAVSGSAALDGEIVAVGPGGRPRPFLALAERIHRKAPTRAMLRSVPVAFVAYDLLADDEGEALDRPWTDRRARLEHFMSAFGTSDTIRLHPAEPMSVVAAPPQSLDSAFRAARERGHEGLVLKRIDAFYEAGRRTASWIKVKQAFATLDCVITAAEEGHGKRAGVWSDYTFGVWSGAEIVNIGKAYSGLTDEEIELLTLRLRKLALERFGRARLIKPEVVLEIAFDGVQRSRRHKSGFALRFPRIVRLRDDKLPEQADTLATVRAIYTEQLESGHREEPAAAPSSSDKPKERELERQPIRGRKRSRTAPDSPVQLSFDFDDTRTVVPPRKR